MFICGALELVVSISFSVFRVNTSSECIDLPDAEPLVTFPDDSTPTEEREVCLASPQVLTTTDCAKTYLNSIDTVKFEKKRMTSASQTKVIADGFSSERVR